MQDIGSLVDSFFFTFRPLNMASHCLLASMISDEKSAANFIQYVMSDESFSLTAFNFQNIFLLSMWFPLWIIWYLEVHCWNILFLIILRCYHLFFFFYFDITWYREHIMYGFNTIKFVENYFIVQYMVNFRWWSISNQIYILQLYCALFYLFPLCQAYYVACLLALLIISWLLYQLLRILH